jgi:hypothetical protein
MVERMHLLDVFISHVRDLPGRRPWPPQPSRSTQAAELDTGHDGNGSEQQRRCLHFSAATETAQQFESCEAARLYAAALGRNSQTLAQPRF